MSGLLEFALLGTLRNEDIPMRGRKLGRRQRAILRSLKHHGGQWYAGCGWIWGSGPFETTQLLESLVARGLVSKSGGKQQVASYRLTPEGEVYERP